MNSPGRSLARDLAQLAAAVTVCAILWLCGEAAATVVIAKDFNALCDEADMIFVGTVVSVDSRWADQERQSIETLVTFSDLSWIRGTPRGAITLRFSGGAVDDIVEEIAGVPQFRPGERRVIFARDAKLVSPIVGFDQGALRVTDGSNGPQVVGPDAESSGGALHLGVPPASGTPVPVSLDEFVERVRRRLANRTPAN